MRALYCTDTYPPQVNGVSVVTHLSVEGLRARGWRVGVVAPRYPDGPDVFGGVRDPDLVSLPSLPCPGYRELRLVAPLWTTVAEVAGRFRPDLIHCATEGAVGWLGQRVGRHLGVPVVTSYHTNFGRYLRCYGAPWLEGPVTRYLTRFHRRATRTLTPSRVTQRELVDRGIDRVSVWGCGVDTATFSPAHRSAERRASLARDDQFLFLHVGRLAPEKGADRILAAFGRCRETLGDRVRLVVAGDGPSRTDLERQAPPGVTFLGYLDRSVELPRLYASADGFVFASETETLGLVVLEAMACGLPVVAAPAGGVADHLSHGVNGLAYPPGDVEAMARFMVDLATEAPLREALSEGARETAMGLGWDRELDRLDACYREILGAGAERLAGREATAVTPAG
jgi:glycosyltransferase involved in cell wall biosynthesis